MPMVTGTTKDDNRSAHCHSERSTALLMSFRTQRSEVRNLEPSNPVYGTRPRFLVAPLLGMTYG